VAQTMSALGAVLVDEGSAPDAEPMLRQALASQRAHHGTDDPRTLATESLLGECLAALGRSTEAESLLVGSARKLRASPYGAKELPGATRRLAEFLRARGHPRGPARSTQPSHADRPGSAWRSLPSRDIRRGSA
jgi:hypothetical protein